MADSGLDGKGVNVVSGGMSDVAAEQLRELDDAALLERLRDADPATDEQDVVMAEMTRRAFSGPF